MNSVYGFTAADTLRLLALAETITALGRDALGDTIVRAERICAEMGFPESEVVYGDTDSVFVHVAGATAEQALDVGARISSECNAHFARKTGSSVLQLEFEALFEGLVLIGKKTYAGLQHAVFEKGTVATRAYGGAEWTIEEHGMSAAPSTEGHARRAARHAALRGARSPSRSTCCSPPSACRTCWPTSRRAHPAAAPGAGRLPDHAAQARGGLLPRRGRRGGQAAHLRLVKLEARSREGTLPQGCTLWGVERVPYYYAAAGDLMLRPASARRMARRTACRPTACTTSS